MERRFVAGLAAVVAATATILTASGAAASDVACVGVQGGGTPNSQLPAAIQVDETQFKVVASFVGIGKQVYDCNSGGTFTFREPVAGLLSRGVQAAIHGKGPFWASFDGSHVDGSGAVPAASPDPSKNIPWLRLVGTSTPNTTGVFSNVTFIQRIDTRGGVTPAGPCIAPKTWPSTTRPSACSGRGSKKRQHRVAPRLPSETERGPALGQCTPVTLQRPCKRGPA